MEKTPLIIVSGPLSPKRVLTKDELVKALRVDLNEFQIQKCEVNKWDTSMKGENGEILISENYQVKLYLLPKITKDLKYAYDALDKILDKIPQEVAFNRGEIDKNGKLGSIFISDSHIDKLDIKKMSMKKKLHVLMESIKRLLEKIDRYGVEELLFGNIGDFFNSDNSHKTTKGTQQENSVSEMDARKYGVEFNIEALQLMKQVANVTGWFLPGNHDWHKMQYLRDMCDLYFKNDISVDIVKSDKERLYKPRGKTLLGATHGANAKEKDLPGLAVVENKTKHDVIEIFKGHIHQYKKTQYPGAIVETLPASGFPGQREDNNGYGSTAPAIVGNVHGKKTGREAQFIENL